MHQVRRSIPANAGVIFLSVLVRHSSLLPASTNKSSYIPALDGLRAIAFLFVFLAHTAPQPIAHLFPQRLGVTLFFFLSGYLITTLLREEARDTGTISLRDFYLRRALRIFIPMYIAYATTVLVALRLRQSTGNLAGFASALLYCYNYARILSPHVLLPLGLPVIWSLSVEEHFYILFPLLFLLWTKKRLKPRTQVQIILALCLAGVLWRTSVVLHGSSFLWSYTATDCRFDSLLWGCLLAVWNNPAYDAPSKSLKARSGLFAALALGFVAADSVIPSTLYREGIRFTLQGVALYFIFYFAIAHHRHWSVRWLEHKPLRYLGWLSYSLYLIHLSIRGALYPYLRHSEWLISPICLLLSLAYAIVVRYLVELPLQRLRTRLRHIAPPVSPTSLLTERV